MRNCDAYYILPGRFQPFHNDHLKILKQALQEISEYIFLGIIVHTFPIKSSETKFESEARRQNSPERNLFTPTERIIMIKDCLREELMNNADKIMPTLLPRPEANWDMIKTMFKGSRIWIIPDVGEEFDNMKADFFTSMGDKVHRVKITPTTDGYSIRRSLKDGTELWKKSVPSSIRKHIKEILRRKQL